MSKVPQNRVTAHFIKQLLSSFRTILGLDELKSDATPYEITKVSETTERPVLWFVPPKDKSRDKRL